MELTKFYEGTKYEIVYGSFSGMEKRALELINSTLLSYVPYVPELVKAPTGSNIPIFIGTAKTNPFVAEKISALSLSYDETYYRVEEDYILIAGGSDSAVFYASCIFVDDYLPRALRREVGHTFFLRAFDEVMPKEERRSKPSVRDRGFWTWGHVIYDYKSYIRNLARLKMNKLTIWNDFPPLNAAEVVDYAHSYGVKIFWGYSWGWDENIDIKSEESMRKWGEYAVKVYSEGYKDTGCDGIYFQMFTEHKTDTLNGCVIAEYAVKWTNYIGSLLLERFPNLQIEFGLHATSVNTHLDIIESTDPRISIVWEDCGSFPYHYNPININSYPETLDFTEKILAVRNGKNFGAVLKGACCLDWTLFAHQKSSGILGMNSEKEISEKEPMRRDMFRAQESAWIANGEKTAEIIKTIASRTAGNASVSDLVEDGLFDRHIWLPCALFAEMCWESDAPFTEILQRVSARFYINK